MKEPKNSQHSVPPRLDYIAGIAWRLLVILGLVAIFIFIIIQLKVVVIPFLVALLVTALLYPLVKWLQKKGVKKGIGVALSMAGMLLVVAGLLFAVVQQVRSAYPELRDRVQDSYASVLTVLSSEPFNIDTSEVNNFTEDLMSFAQNNSSTLLSGLSSVGSTAGNVATGIFVALFCVIFLLLDGKNIWRWTTNLVPKISRPRVFDAGLKGWNTLINFVKSQVAVAGVDAVGIGIGALLLQVPLAIPIAVLVFLGSFIPVVGAIVTGMIAVVLALIFNGWIAALLMLGVVLLVQFIEGNILQPFLMGKAVKIHPLAIVLAVAVGTLLAGIPGALFSVPIVAVVNVMLVAILGEKKPTPKTAS